MSCDWFCVSPFDVLVKLIEVKDSAFFGLLNVNTLRSNDSTIRLGDLRACMKRFSIRRSLNWDRRHSAKKHYNIGYTNDTFTWMNLYSFSYAWSGHIFEVDARGFYFSRFCFLLCVFVMNSWVSCWSFFIFSTGVNIFVNL